MEQGFAVVLVAGLAVFGLMFVASESDLTSPNAPDQDSVVYTQENIGNVGGAETDIRNISFRSFTVGEGRGDIQAYNSEQQQISSSLFSGETITVKYNATQPQGGQINFEVLGRTGQGKIWAEVNGREVFKAATVTGATPQINFSANAVKPGMNTIKIGTTKGGLLDSATYSLEDIEVTVNDRKFHDYDGSFELYNSELSNYVSSNLSFSIPMDASRPEAPLDIEVNGNQIYSESIVRSTQDIVVDKREAGLNPGYNTIKYSTEGEAKYQIDNPEIVMRYIGSTEPETSRTEFEMTAGQLSYANQDDTTEYISFNYQNMMPSSQKLNITINGNSYIETPENGENQIEIQSNNLQSENTLIVSSQGAFRMQNLQILSERSEQ